MSAPTVTQRDWLEQVWAVDPEYYAAPVVYEFTGARGGVRKFYKNDAQWYDNLKDILTFDGTEDLVFEEPDKLQF